MAGGAALGAVDEVLIVVEAEGDHLRVLGVGLDVRADPLRGRAVAALAADAFGDVELPGALF